MAVVLVVQVSQLGRLCLLLHSLLNSSTETEKIEILLSKYLCL